MNLRFQPIIDQGGLLAVIKGVELQNGSTVNQIDNVYNQVYWPNGQYTLSRPDEANCVNGTVFGSGVNGSITEGGYNIQSDTTCFASSSTAPVGAFDPAAIVVPDPGLGPLQE
jgi:hypothetical protein